MLTKADKIQIQNHGLEEAHILRQIAKFRDGVKYLKLNRPCTIGDGITRIDEGAYTFLTEKFELAQAEGRVQKFVPASGAATRMFKNLINELNNNHVNEAEAAEVFFLLPQFALFDELEVKLSQHGISFGVLQKKKDIKTLLAFLLTDRGLNLANLPKLLIPFHRYSQGNRTPFAEHLIEAEQYARDKNGIARLHFTISPKHETLFQTHMEKVLETFCGKTMFEIGYSFQKPYTDTIAVDLNFEPFRTQNDELVFRPGGHGALIENINVLSADLLFIKNVDNILPDPAKKNEVKYKKILAGYLLAKEEQIFEILQGLENDIDNSHAIANGLNFIQKQLQIELPVKITTGNEREKAHFVRQVLNRPIRVCGMVKNAGDPGGGPFWVENKEGVQLRQIVEQVQIEVDDPAQNEILKQSTHFNPVDLVCSLRDVHGKPFDLRTFIDPDAGFISTKSIDGCELLALELPGLWNGAMTYWTTFFVEMPPSTFNPVKTFFDLMRPEHRGDNL